MIVISNKSILLTGIIFVIILCQIDSTVEQTTTPTTEPVPTTTADTTTTLSPEDVCQKSNSSCKDCVSNSGCYYCYKTKSCYVYPVKSLKPYEKCGELKDMAWKTCLVDFKVLIIVLSSVGGTILLISIICCCCLCKKVRRAQLRRQIEKWERRRTDQKAMQEERRNERELKRNQIREKYGLSPNSNPYSRFD